MARKLWLGLCPYTLLFFFDLFLIFIRVYRGRYPKFDIVAFFIRFNLADHLNDSFAFKRKEKKKKIV